MSDQPKCILIQNGTLLSHDGARLSEMAGWLTVEGERIAAVGAGDAPDEWRARADRVIDARHMAVLPGLVNGHTHLSQTFLRGLADDRPLLRWLKEVIWPAQAAMTPEDQYLAGLLGLVENLRCGVTTVVQHHKLPGTRLCRRSRQRRPDCGPADGACPRLGGPRVERRAARKHPGRVRLAPRNLAWQEP